MSKHVKLLVFVVFIFELVIFSSLLDLLLTLKTVQHDCERICIPDKNKEIVCGCRAERLQNHLRTVFKEEFLQKNEDVKGKQNEIRNLKITSFMKPNAHLGGWMDESYHENKNETALATLRNWRDDGKDMFLRNGIIHRNGRLVVPYSGVYHVYCFIDMRYYQEEKQHSFNIHSLKYAIYKSNIQNLGTNKELLTAFHTPDIPGITHMSVYDNFLSADVELHAGDEVYVKVWNRNLIRNPTLNIFGIYLI